jgi:hypothetical protein
LKKNDETYTRIKERERLKGKRKGEKREREKVRGKESPQRRPEMDC